jgi:hypothetical protein
MNKPPEETSHTDTFAAQIGAKAARKLKARKKYHTASGSAWE